MVKLGSGRNWVDHLIQMATGIQSTLLPTQVSLGNGSFIWVLDHFLRNGDKKHKKTNYGSQIVMREGRLIAVDHFIVDIRLFHQYQYV